MPLPIFEVTPCRGELSVEGGRAFDGYGPANTASLGSEVSRKESRNPPQRSASTFSSI